MDETTTQMHLAAGEHYGREATCGTKYDYKSEGRADMAAHAVSLKHSDGKVLEAYPCFFCEGWHIGRAMSADERVTFTPGAVGELDSHPPAKRVMPDHDRSALPEQERREIAYENRGQLANDVEVEPVGPKLFETIENNRQHPERGLPRPERRSSINYERPPGNVYRLPEPEDDDQK